MYKRQHLPQAAHLELGSPIDQIRAAGDVVVLPLANQLGKHTDLGQAAARLAAINLPVIGIGLGAQAGSPDMDVQITEGTRAWLQVISKLRPDDGPNIGVRGAYTLEQLGKLGFPDLGVVVGCPSNFINLEADIATAVEVGFARPPRRIAVAAGIPYIPSLAHIERDLADVVTLTGGAYIVQHGLEMLQLARREFAKMGEGKLEAAHNYIMPNRTTAEFCSWCERYAYAHYDARSWMDFLRRFDFVVGTRFHGIMLAIQAGVPGACIAHDSRTIEMCETMGIPVRHYSEIDGEITQHNVRDYFHFDSAAYTEKRHKLLDAYVSLLTRADMPLTTSLRVPPRSAAS